MMEIWGGADLQDSPALSRRGGKMRACESRVTDATKRSISPQNDTFSGCGRRTNPPGSKQPGGGRTAPRWRPHRKPHRNRMHNAEQLLWACRRQTNPPGGGHAKAVKPEAHRWRSGRHGRECACETNPPRNMAQHGATRRNISAPPAPNEPTGPTRGVGRTARPFVRARP